MMPEIRNMKALEDYLQKHINSALQDEVTSDVKVYMSDVIQSVVYDAYTPKMYIRRGAYGGLGDQNNITGTLVSDGQLEIANEAPFNGANPYKDTLTEVIVTGEGYNYDPGIGPRDFIQATKDVLANTKAHVDALKNGMKKRGFDVK